MWSLLKRSLINLTELVKTWLKRMQYRSCLIDGLVAKTEFNLPCSLPPAVTDVTMMHLVQHVSTDRPVRS
ncbi:hypothetical protein QF034_000160 [Streptomyces africanus]|uniref:Uncharacterized protein n=1 Tax=Streptomyces africanus TaxID=231024 RepID=A0ABU0QEW4_9ACTN|nr:hypothetical protein [Streptomyces africanus]